MSRNRSRRTEILAAATAPVLPTHEADGSPVVTSETTSGTPAEVISDEPQQTETPAPDAAPVETSETPSEQTPAEQAPALAPDVAQKVAQIDARIALLDTMLAEGKDEKSELRKLRVSLVGGSTTSGGGAGSRSGKSVAQRKQERTDYRFARRYAKKHNMTIEAARKLLAEGKISKQVRVPAVTVDEIASLRAQLAAAHAALKAAGQSVGDDVPSLSEAEQMAAAIDAQQAAEELTPATV